MHTMFDTRSMADYRKFLAVKTLPSYRFVGDVAYFADEYADRILGVTERLTDTRTYHPHPRLFDYQRDIVRTAIGKRKFCVFADCGLGKTLMFLEFIRFVAQELSSGQCILIVSPLMVIKQTLEECERFYGEKIRIRQIAAAELDNWLLRGKGRIGITNYEALRDSTRAGRLGCLVLDESSMLKSHYGKWGMKCLELGNGLDWKLACTGTPAPNDRIEYANHAVFMDAFPTINSFLARYFVNRGQTGERWVLKPHALGPFYHSLSHWCIFLTNPATYGWKDNCETVPPIHVTIHDVPMTLEQQQLGFGQTGRLFADQIGGIISRSVLSQIAKGNHRGVNIASYKPDYIRQLVESWPDESTIIWCIYNKEQERLEAMFPEAASMTGNTPIIDRERMIADFKAGRQKVLISKPKILGFGLNLHIATRQVFSGLQDSYESYYQAVKRSNRIGSTRPLNVHIPITDIERPMVDTVIQKSKRIQQDTEEQERVFKNAS